MNSSQLIEKLNRFYDKLGSDRKYSFLITGNWGIGKTHTYNEFVKEKNPVYYYSLFGISSLRELEKMILKDVIFPTFNKLDSETTPRVFGNIVKGLLKDVTKFKNTLDAVSPSNILEALTFRDLSFTSKSLLCFDDLERCKIPIEDLMGFIERLKQKTNIIVLCNENEIDEKQLEKYKSYKEKVIDFSYRLVEIEDEIILNKLSSNLEWISENVKSLILEEFKKYSKGNLRVLNKLIHLVKEIEFDLKIKEDFIKLEDKILKNCFYVVCENNISLISDLEIEKLEVDLELSEKIKERSKDINEESWKNHKYWIIYEVSEGNLINEIENYYFGNKINTEKIDFYLRKEIERKADGVLELFTFVEDKVKCYFLLNRVEVLELVNNIEMIVKNKIELKKLSVKTLFELYLYYLYFCQRLNKKSEEETLKKIEEYLYNDLEAFLDIDPFVINEVIQNSFIENQKKLEEQFREKKRVEKEKRIKDLLYKKKYLEILEEVDQLTEIPEEFLSYLKDAFERPIVLEEWQLWNRIVKRFNETEKKKLEFLVGNLEINDQFTKQRINMFCQNTDLECRIE